MRLKCIESGAGRFTDFLLPPLTFYEYLDLRSQTGLVESNPEGQYRMLDIEGLNREFIDYCNFGGYPQAALSEAVRQNPDRFIRADLSRFTHKRSQTKDVSRRFGPARGSHTRLLP